MLKLGGSTKKKSKKSKKGTKAIKAKKAVKAPKKKVEQVKHIKGTQGQDPKEYSVLVYDPEDDAKGFYTGLKAHCTTRLRIQVGVCTTIEQVMKLSKTLGAGAVIYPTYTTMLKSEKATLKDLGVDIVRIPCTNNGMTQAFKILLERFWPRAIFGRIINSGDFAKLTTQLCDGTLYEVAKHNALSGSKEAKAAKDIFIIPEGNELGVSLG